MMTEELEAIEQIEEEREIPSKNHSIIWTGGMQNKMQGHRLDSFYCGHILTRRVLSEK